MTKYRDQTENFFYDAYNMRHSSLTINDKISAAKFLLWFKKVHILWRILNFYSTYYSSSFITYAAHSMQREHRDDKSVCAMLDLDC